MLTPNGGVFGRNPKFNNVTVDGNLTVNGDIALGDDIVVADSLTVQGTEAAISTTTGALRVTGGVGIGGALYTGGNVVVGGTAVVVGANGLIVAESAGTGGSGTRLGVLAGGANSTGIANTALGRQAGRFTTTGNNNTSVGAFALENNVTGSANVAVGWRALDRNLASDIVGVGASALAGNTLGTANVAVGRSALGAATTAIGTFTTTPVAAGSGYTANQTGVTVTLVKKSGADTFTGTVQAALTTNASGAVTAVAATPVSAGATFTGTNVIFEPSGFGGSGCEISIATLDSSANNTALGHQAGLSISTGDNNTIVGALAGDAITSGGDNTLIGFQAGSAITSGSQNTAVGRTALLNNLSGSGNIAIGWDSLRSQISSNTVAVGAYALRECDGSGNAAVGNEAGRYRGASGDLNTSATNSLFIGYRARANGNSQTNQVVIAGTDGLGDGSNTTVIGNTSTTSTRIPGGNLTLTNGNLILGTAGNGISFAATTDPTIAATKATGAITRTATNVANNDTVTIDTTVYTFKTTLTPADYEVLIGADASASLTNLRHAILGTGGTPGTDYQVPAAHPTVTALAISGSNLPLEAITAGTAGNSIALAETSAELSVNAATLLGGRAAQGMSGEILSDYEVGTWTPVYQSTGGTLIVTQTVSNAFYVKVGNLVTVQGYINTQFVDASNASGTLRIAGLPYAVGNAHSVGSIYGQGWASNANPVLGLVTSGNTISLIKRAGSDARSGITGSAVADLMTTGSASNQCVITLSYYTAA